MKYRNCLFVCLLVSLVVISCRKPSKFPAEPVLEFISLEKVDNGTEIDSLAVLKLHFTHGDGNIGIDASDDDNPLFNDTSSFYYYNFYVLYYAKRNGEFVQLPEGAFNARLPRFLSSKNPEPLEGEIEYVLLIRNPIFTTAPKMDTIKFECWIIDRELRESNRVTTPEITVVNRL